MKTKLMLLVLSLNVGALAIAQKGVETKMAYEHREQIHIEKLTPNLYTDDVESCVKFWVEDLHFEKTMEVKADKGLAFAALRKGNIELMYGSYASLEADPATAKAVRKGTSFLFIQVSDIDAALSAVSGAKIVSPIHKTPYGSTEFTIADPAGHLLTFAHFAHLP